MILQSLFEYYETLAAKGLIPRPGWAKVKVSFAVDLAEDGSVKRIVPLSVQETRGKKTVSVPRNMELPAPVKRTVGISSNFLWDNSSYILGYDDNTDEKKMKRVADCFDLAREYHLGILSGVDSPFARAVSAFYRSWDPSLAAGAAGDLYDEIAKGGNLVFMFDGSFPSDDPALCAAWQTYYDGEEDGEKMRCLVTGETVVPAKVHPAIKNVVGAQSSGAAIISFNAAADCSYEHKQDLNAPVGKYAAFAYTTALNTLLADKAHVKRFGDTTLVYWAQNAEPAYQDVFGGFMEGGSDVVSDDDLDRLMTALSRGETAEWKNIPMIPSDRFYILGLAPNASRLSVRFFLRGKFGDFVTNIEKHYDDIRIARDGRYKWENIPLWKLLGETVNQNASKKDPLPQMAGDTLRSILTGTAYPATFYQQTQIRLRAERNVTQGRAAIVKAYLLRLHNNDKFKEVLTVQLNEDSVYQPYVLGRLFSVLEAIQKAANPIINTTIKDKYFTSAGATPGIVFPTLLNLAQKHLRKLSDAQRIYYSKQLTDLIGRITETYPAHHTIYEQGIFQLGYYHQTQKRFEKKDKNTTAAAEIKEEANNE